MIALGVSLLLLLFVAPAGAQGPAARRATSLGHPTAADSVLPARGASRKALPRAMNASRERILLFTDGPDLLVLILPQVDECDETASSLGFRVRHARVVVRY